MELGKGESVELPDPRLCNLQLSVARVNVASGFAEVVDEIIRYERQSGDQEDLYDFLWRRLVLNEAYFPFEAIVSNHQI